MIPHPTQPDHRACLWPNPFQGQYATVTHLNALMPPGSGWILQSAEHINENGHIVGSCLHNGQTRAFLMTP